MGRVFRNIYKEHMDKTKVGWDQGWEVGMGGGGGEKWGQLYLNNNFKKCKKKKVKKKKKKCVQMCVLA